MPDVLNLRIVAGLRFFSRLGSVAAVLLGGLVLLGWVVGSRPMVTVFPGLAAMSPVTAFAFVLGGASLIARQRPRPGVADTLATLLLALSLVVLAGYGVAGHDVLNPVVGNRLSATPDSPVGSTAPATACGFLLLGTSLLRLGRPGERHALIVTACAGSGLLLSGLALLGYAYGVEGLYATAFYRTTALHTAAGLFVLFLACLFHDPRQGWAAIIASGLPNGVAVRMQLLLTTLLPFLVGLVVLQALRAGSIAPSFAIAILVASTTVPLVVRIFVDGRMLDSLDMQRRAAVEAQRRLNDELETRVRARTADLALSEARLRTYFDHAPEGLAVFRQADDGTFVYDDVNPAFRTLYAIGDRVVGGLPPSAFISEAANAEIQQHLRQCVLSGRMSQYTAERQVKDRLRTINVVLAPVPVAEPGGPRIVVGSMRDVTDAVMRDEQLRQAQKMEAIGQLTGGLAHDFNNLLAGIIGSLEILAKRLAQGRTTDLERYIGAADDAAKRAAALTHRLLAFSRRQTLAPQLTDINGVVAGMEDLVRRTIGPSIALEVVAAIGVWTTLLDPPQLESALLNLCINARDAMPAGGTLRIETANTTVDRAGDGNLPSGEYVTLCVSDTGTGMTPDVMARAFDPFFTTKPTGTGTGLGLSMIYGFAQQSGGDARISSEPGRGTTVCLYLPRDHGVLEDAGIPTPLVEAPHLGTLGTVLVVDDEPTVRMLVVEILADLGFTTIEAAEGASGLRVLQSAGRIDLLITDVGLPGGINGRQVADAARVSRPTLKVLFITGYAEAAALSHGQLEPGMHVLTKPFAMETLASQVKQLVSG